MSPMRARFEQHRAGEEPNQYQDCETVDHVSLHGSPKGVLIIVPTASLIWITLLGAVITTPPLALYARSISHSNSVECNVE